MNVRLRIAALILGLSACGGGAGGGDTLTGNWGGQCGTDYLEILEGGVFTNGGSRGTWEAVGPHQINLVGGGETLVVDYEISEDNLIVRAGTVLTCSIKRRS